jgi:hypothetical protein
MSAARQMFMDPGTNMGRSIVSGQASSTGPGPVAILFDLPPGASVEAIEAHTDDPSRWFVGPVRGAGVVFMNSSVPVEALTEPMGVPYSWRADRLLVEAALMAPNRPPRPSFPVATRFSYRPTIWDIQQRGLALRWRHQARCRWRARELPAWRASVRRYLRGEGQRRWVQIALHIQTFCER